MDHVREWGQALGEAAPRSARPDHGFAHASEAEFARILDFYEVAWEYEAHVFPILWDLDGNVLESFAPDFFLPDMDVFVELTTLQQHLVRKKNRKVRRLRELYPNLRIKLFYARDFRALMLKYGRAGLLGELSGPLGQVSGHDGDAETQGRESLPAKGTGMTRALAETAGAAGAAGAPDAGEPPRRSRAARRRANRAESGVLHRSPAI